jgi:putative hemolysin
MEEQTMKHILMVTLVLGALINGVCVPMPPPTATPPPDLPNLASEYGADQGHKLEIRTENGGQVGYDLFSGADGLGSCSLISVLQRNHRGSPRCFMNSSVQSETNGCII